MADPSRCGRRGRQIPSPTPIVFFLEGEEILHEQQNAGSPLSDESVVFGYLQSSG